MLQEFTQIQSWVFTQIINDIITGSIIGVLSAFAIVVLRKT